MRKSTKCATLYSNIHMYFNSSAPYKMAGILADVTFNCIFKMKLMEFRFKMHWNLFPGVQLTISQHCSGNGLAPNRRQAITWTNAEPAHWRVYAALGEDELTAVHRDACCFLQKNAIQLVLWDLDIDKRSLNYWKNEGSPYSNKQPDERKLEKFLIGSLSYYWFSSPYAQYQLVACRNSVS